MKNFKLKLFFLSVLFLPLQTFAFQIIKAPDVPMMNDFILSPAKINIEMNSGEEKEEYVYVENRGGEPSEFEISFEDLEYSGDPVSPVKIKNSLNKNISLSKFLSVEKKKFILEHGEKAIFPIFVKIPALTENGGLQSSILVSGKKISQNAEGKNAKIIARLGSSIFVKIKNSKLIEKGKFSSFEFKENKFLVGFENEGNIHLNPYGIIEVKDIFGRIKNRIGISSWSVLPGSAFVREINLGDGDSFFFRKALATVYPGYGNEGNIETKSVWIYPNLFEVSFYLLSVLFLIWLLVRM